VAIFGSLAYFFPFFGKGNNLQSVIGALAKMPPSELITLPSNPAVIFFWQILGKVNGRRVSSSVAGMADSRFESDVDNQSLCIPGGCTMPVSESLLCGERQAKSPTTLTAGDTSICSLRY
jgi:hypothetical protein